MIIDSSLEVLKNRVNPSLEWLKGKGKGMDQQAPESPQELMWPMSVTDGRVSSTDVMSAVPRLCSL